MQRIGVMLVAASVAVAGCGARATMPTPQPASDPSTETTLDSPGGVSDPTVLVVTTTTTAESSSATPVDTTDVAADEIDSMLSDIDDTLAELDQLLNDAAAALAAEEGEILP